MRILFLMAIILSTNVYADSIYDQFTEFFKKGERAATYEDLKRIDECYVSSNASNSSVFNMVFKYSLKEINLGPILGTEQMEIFQFEVRNDELFHLNEKDFEVSTSHNSLIFEEKGEYTSYQKVWIKFGYEGKEMILIDMNNKVPTGSDDYYLQKFTGQCTLKK